MERLVRVLRPLDTRNLPFLSFQGREYIDFSSNDYLGLSSHPKLKDTVKLAVDEFGLGACASRLLSGDSKLYHQLEARVAQFKGKESALAFTSGYQANVGILSALTGRGDAIFLDKLAHASLVDGAFLSGAKLFRFRHNDMAHLSKLLENERNKFEQAVIVTESVFSMDGDIALLEEIVELKEKFKCSLFVDEAHATGVFGRTGAGVVSELGLENKVEFIMGTFSKAMGSFGAYLACDTKTKDFLINNCRSFIYTTALPAPIIAANIVAIDLVCNEPFRRKSLLENADYFRGQVLRLGFKVSGDSQIVPIIIGDVDKTVNLSEALKDRGFWVLPIRPPTVPVNQARLRFSLSYVHSRKIIDRLIVGLKEVMSKVGTGHRACP